MLLGSGPAAFAGCAFVVIAYGRAKLTRHIHKGSPAPSGSRKDKMTIYTFTTELQRRQPGSPAWETVDGPTVLGADPRPGLFADLDVFADFAAAYVSGFDDPRGPSDYRFVVSFSDGIYTGCEIYPV